MVALTHKCKKCKREDKRSVSHIDPKLYKDSSKAIIKLGFWCKHCGTNSGIEYKCLADGTVQVIGEFDPTPQVSKFKLDTPTDDDEEWLETEEVTPTLQPEDIVVEVVD